MMATLTFNELIELTTIISFSTVFFSVSDHFVGLALKTLSCESNMLPVLVLCSYRIHTNTQSKFEACSWKD